MKRIPETFCMYQVRQEETRYHKQENKYHQRRQIGLTLKSFIFRGRYSTDNTKL